MRISHFSSILFFQCKTFKCHLYFGGIKLCLSVLTRIMFCPPQPCTDVCITVWQRYLYLNAFSGGWSAVLSYIIHLIGRLKSWVEHLWHFPGQRCHYRCKYTCRCFQCSRWIWIWNYTICSWFIIIRPNQLVVVLICSVWNSCESLADYALISSLTGSNIA